MDTWLHAIHADGNQLYRWYVLNSSGEQILVSVKAFSSEIDAKTDLDDFLKFMGR